MVKHSLKYGVCFLLLFSPALVIANAISPPSGGCNLLPTFDTFYNKLLSTKEIGEAFEYIDPEPALKLTSDINANIIVSRFILTLALNISNIDAVYAYNESCHIEAGTHIGELKLKVKTSKLFGDGADRVELLFKHTGKQWKIISYESWNSNDSAHEHSVKYIELTQPK